MANLTALLDLESVDPADTTDVQTHHVSDKKFGTGSGDTPASTGFLPIISSAPPPRVVELGGGASASGASAPKDITIELQKYVAGNDTSRLAFLDGRNILGRSAYLRYVGTGGDGTVYTLDNPAVVARGKVIAPMIETPRSLTITIRPHQRAHQVQLPRRRFLGYPHGLRGNGNTSEAEVPFNLVPAAFTLVALVLTPRVWTVGATDHQTVFGQASVHSYFEETGDNARRLMLDVRNAADSAWHTLTGSAFDPDEDVHFMTWRFDTSTLAARFGLDSTFEDIAAPADFGALTGNWKLGRLLTSTTDVSDTIMGATALFGSWLTDSEVIDIISGRMSGDEEGDLKFFHPGEATGGVLFDYAAANSDSPLDATITDAVEAPMFTGTAQLSGTAPPEISGYVQNAGLIPIDPSRKIYAIGNEVGAIFDVYDRAAPYTIEAQYSSPLELADGGPTISGNVAVSPHMGGLVQVHTEVDGARNTADCGGLGRYNFSLNLGDDFGSSEVNFGTQLDAVYNTGEWTQTIYFYWDDDDPDGAHVWKSDHWSLTVRSDRGDTVIMAVTIETSGGITNEITMTFTMGKNQRVAVSVGARNVSESGIASRARVVVNGRTVADGIGSFPLRNAASVSDAVLGGTFLFDHLGTLPMRLWSIMATTDDDAEDLQRLYLFDNPPPGEAGLEGLWYRHRGDDGVLVDETSNGYDGIVDSGAVWGPRPGCISPISASRYFLSDVGAPQILRDSAYDAIGGASGHVFAQGQTVAQASGAILDGGGLYQVLDPDGSVIVGLQPDPSTATPIATLIVEDPHPAKTDSLPPSMVRAFYGFNPTVQTSVLAGADDDRKSFAAEPWRSVDEEVEHASGEPNRKVYDDEDPPDGRRLEIYTGYVSKSAAKAEAERRGAIWAAPRPIRTAKVLRVLDTDGSLLGEGGGMNSLQVGEVYKIRWSEPQPVHGRTVLVEEAVQLLSARQLEEQDVIVVR